MAATDVQACSRPHFLVQAAVQEAEAQAAPAEKKLWGGRFTGKTDPLMEKFNESLPFDKRMWKEDIRVSTAQQHRSSGTHL